MSWMVSITADQIMLSLLACCALREAMIAFLPNEIAGPGGTLVNTHPEG